MTNVLLVDDHNIVLDGLEAVLTNADKEIHIVDKVNDMEGMRSAVSNEVDVVVMDINLPGESGMVLSTFLKENYPGIKIVILTSYDDARVIRDCLKIGVDGYVLKNRGIDEVYSAIQSVLKNEKYFSAEINEKLAAMVAGVKLSNDVSVDRKTIDSLSKREIEVLQLIALEYTSKEIGNELHISADTVNSYRKSLLRKTKSKNLAGLVKFAISNEVITIK